MATSLVMRRARRRTAQRVAAIQRLSTAFFRSTLYHDDPAFSKTVAMQPAAPEGSVETK
ncbi:hypothetical protein FY140_07100 [Agrobacterium tumefaciens]|uniref:hypothetical protein n=1 Tax=Agrobacterium tumefaciens TaxID=358 RepID=UPI001572CA32|nr:hypothetical protein [Agrobacterium tumefaciens]NTB97355.1 hypothetical protein [Agrobacterium tumefaciens]NTC46964.1 hypothetical protein [Agrobacterium tumefaciens]UXT20490.1 hypothetical protein FY140_07100 [Agrobacterium tumefaciens]